MIFFYTLVTESGRERTSITKSLGWYVNTAEWL